jgi:hypothetical protein
MHRNRLLEIKSSFERTPFPSPYNKQVRELIIAVEEYLDMIDTVTYTLRDLVENHERE